MRMFLPPKPSHYFCCWDHHELHYAQHDYRGYKRSSDEHYDRGYNDAWRQAKPLTFGGKFRHTWDGLRRYLGLEVDRGEMTPEGAEALRLHQAQGRAEREKREAALRQAIKAAKERGEILPTYLRAS
jgi:hypothetical protein